MLTAAAFVLAAAFVFAVPAESNAAPSYREKDKKCMDECHGKPGLYYTPAGYWGTLRSASLDYERFTRSKHGIFTCVECHTDADAGEKTHLAARTAAKCESCHVPEDRYTPAVRELFLAKGIKMDDRKRIADDYAGSVHGKAYALRKKNAPYCTGCHDPHGANLKDSASPVSRCNLPATCGRCHPGQTPAGTGLFSRMALTRVNGHRKGDAGVDYSRTNCVLCHQGDAAHGKPLSGDKCMTCHKTKESALNAGFHGGDLPLLSILLNFGLLFGLVLTGGTLVFFFGGRNGEKK